MKISYNFSVSATLLNRTYAKNKLSAKKLDITLVRETEETFSGSELKSVAEYVTQYLDDTIVINVFDTDLIDYLEPKSGNTVHNRLNELKSCLTGRDWQLIGNTVPAETKNSYQLLIFGEDMPVTLENVAEWIKYNWSEYKITSVIVSDGSLTIEV